MKMRCRFCKKDVEIDNLKETVGKNGHYIQGVCSVCKHKLFRGLKKENWGKIEEPQPEKVILDSKPSVIPKPKEVIQEIVESVEDKKDRWFKKQIGAWITGFWCMLVLTGLFLYWYVFKDAKYTFTDARIVLYLILSIFLNLLILGLSFGTGVGIKSFRHFFRRFRYRSGNFVYDLFITKNGKIRDVFTKIDKTSGAFYINDKPYVRNPKLLFMRDNIPTYIHREEHPEPLNAWGDIESRDASSSEIDIVMSAADSFNLRRWIEQHWLTVLLLAGVIIILALAGTYYTYQNYTMQHDLYPILKNLSRLKPVVQNIVTPTNVQPIPVSVT